MVVAKLDLGLHMPTLELMGSLVLLEKAGDWQQIQVASFPLSKSLTSLNLWAAIQILMC
jgi:hypothetical protein